MAEEFKIEDDKTADWAIQTIAAEEQERDRLIALAQEEIKDLEDRIEEIKRKCDNETAYLRSCLYNYFSIVPHKSTKTQESYKLLSGTLVFKKPTAKIIHDDDKLIEYLDGTEYVEVKKSLKWGELKKSLEISGNDIINSETGEVMEGCSIEDVPGSFDIKF